MKKMRTNRNGIRPPTSLRKTPVDAAARKVLEDGGRTIIGNLGNPGAYSRWGVMDAYQECFVHVTANTDPNRLHGYGASIGVGELQDAIANLEIDNVGVKVESKDVLVGAGISNIVDPLLRMIRSVYGKGNVVIATPGYVLYHWEGERIGIEIRACKTKKGQVDIEQLESVVDEDTKAVVLYSVSNPISIATTYDTFCGVFNVIDRVERNKKGGMPIAVIVDDVYRVFQDIGSQLDLSRALKYVGRCGPTILLDSISKMLGASGDRLGYIKLIRGEGFIEKTNELMDRLITDLQITLGTVSMPVQLAFLEFLRRIQTDGRFRERVQDEIAERRKRVRECNTVFMEALVNEPGIRLHPQYGFNGEIDPNLVVAPYVVFGYDPGIMESSSQAEQLVLDAHSLGKPAPLFTPMDVFELREGMVWPGMRAVPMWGNNTRAEVIDSILAVRDHHMSIVG